MRSSPTCAARSLLSLIIGTSAGLGLWIFGVTGLLPHGESYALVFGAGSR